MSAKTTARQQWVRALAAVAVVTGVYVFAVYRPTLASVREAQRRLEQARTSAVAPGDLAAKRHMLADLKDRLAVMKRRGNQAPSRPSVTTYAGLTLRDETMMLATVSDVLIRHDVIVMNAARSSGRDAGKALPADTADALKRVFETKDDILHGIWHMQVVGSFDGMKDALDTIGGLDEFVLPLSISMEPAHADRIEHDWSLWVWM